VALLLAGLAVRLVFLALEPPTRLVGDERTWVAAAREIASPEVRFDPLRTKLIFYPPLHPYLLAAANALLGGRTGVKVVQAVLGSLLVLPVFSIGLSTFDRRVAVLAAGFAAFYPELVWQSVHLWSEPLFMALLWAAIALLVSWESDGRTRTAAAAGVLLGLAALTRDPALYFAPLAAVWLALARRSSVGEAGPRRACRRPVGAALAFLAGVFLVVAPWTLRNEVRFGAPIPVSLMGARTFWEANASRHREVIDQYAAIEQAEGPLAAYRQAWSEGIAAVRARQPWWLLEQIGRQLPQFWTSANLVVIHLERQAYGPVTPGVAWLVLAVTALPHVLVTAAFLLGLAALPVNRRSGLLLLFLAYYQAVHLVTLGHPRLRLPALPAVFVIAAAALFYGRRGTLVWTPARRLIAGLLLLAFSLCLVQDFAGYRVEPVFGLS
jgi:4-amino-4-deoxy-L-arabinose transferase-like glycosyltransferase